MRPSTLRHFLCGAAICAAALVASPAFAQTDAEKAAELYKQGLDLYFAEDFGVAITKFRAGYELDPNPMFLYSLSLCFAKLGNYPDALDHAARAAQKREMLPPEEAVKNDARIVAYATRVQTQTLADAKLAEARGGVKTCLTNADCSTGEVCNIRRGVCVAELPVDTSPARPPLLELFSPVGWAGVGAATVGTGLLIGGGFTSLAVKRNEDKLADASFDGDRVELADKITRQKSTGRVLVVGGAGLVLVGAGLIVVDLLVLRSDDAPGSTVAPVVSPHGGGLVWIGRF